MSTDIVEQSHHEQTGKHVVVDYHFILFSGSISPNIMPTYLEKLSYLLLVTSFALDVHLFFPVSKKNILVFSTYYTQYIQRVCIQLCYSQTF